MDQSQVAHVNQKQQDKKGFATDVFSTLEDFSWG
jgi:hypothetical protein